MGPVRRRASSSLRARHQRRPYGLSFQAGGRKADPKNCCQHREGHELHGLPKRAPSAHLAQQLAVRPVSAPRNDIRSMPCSPDARHCAERMLPKLIWLRPYGPAMQVRLLFPHPYGRQCSNDLSLSRKIGPALGDIVDTFVQSLPAAEGRLPSRNWSPTGPIWDERADQPEPRQPGP